MGETISQWRRVIKLHITFVNHINIQRDDDAGAKIIVGALQHDCGGLADWSSARRRQYPMRTIVWQWRQSFNHPIGNIDAAGGPNASGGGIEVGGHGRCCSAS